MNKVVLLEGVLKRWIDEKRSGTGRRLKLIQIGKTKSF